MKIDKYRNPIGFGSRKIVNILGDGTYKALTVPEGVEGGTMFITAHDGDDATYTSIVSPIEFHMKDAVADDAFMALTQLSLPQVKAVGEVVGYFKLEAGNNLAVIFLW